MRLRAISPFTPPLTSCLSPVRQQSMQGLPLRSLCRDCHCEEFFPDCKYLFLSLSLHGSQEVCQLITEQGTSRLEQAELLHISRARGPKKTTADSQDQPNVISFLCGGGRVTFLKPNQVGARPKDSSFEGPLKPDTGPTCG